MSGLYGPGCSPAVRVASPRSVWVSLVWVGRRSGGNTLFSGGIIMSEDAEFSELLENGIVIETIDDLIQFLEKLVPNMIPKENNTWSFSKKHIGTIVFALIDFGFKGKDGEYAREGLSVTITASWTGAYIHIAQQDTACNAG